jgi:outer membrane immunogenic protein
MQSRFVQAAAFVAAFAFSATASFYATAADLGGYSPKYGGPPPASYAPPMDNWSGWYFGGVLGYGWGDVGIRGTGSYDTNGVVGGGLLGWNYQAGRLVVGLEGDLLASGVDGSTAGGLHSADVNWIGSLRARAGVTVVPELLIFASIGAAWADYDFAFAGAGGGSSSKVVSGLQYGAGAEVKLTDQWSARFDYLYTDFDSKTVTFGDPDLRSRAAPGARRAGLQVLNSTTGRPAGVHRALRSRAVRADPVRPSVLGCRAQLPRTGGRTTRSRPHSRRWSSLWPQARGSSERVKQIRSSRRRSVRPHTIEIMSGASCGFAARKSASTSPGDTDSGAARLR